MKQKLKLKRKSQRKVRSDFMSKLLDEIKKICDEEGIDFKEFIEKIKLN